MRPKFNICLLISFIIGAAYAVYLVSYFTTAGGNAASDAEAVGYGIAAAIVFPHMVCTIVAVIFNALGLFMRKPAFALVGAILYAVAMVLFPMYFFFVLAEMILSFVGYAQMRKQVQGNGGTA